MSFECNNGVCYLKSGSGFGSGIQGEFPMPKRDDVWTIYGREGCPYCVKMKQFFCDIGIKHIYYDVNAVPQGDKAKERLADLTSGYQMVPMVFFYGKFIGGYTETMKFLGVDR